MKKNHLLKVLSAAALATTLSATTDFSLNNNRNYAHAAETTSKVVTVPATLRNFNEPNKLSMGNAALSKVTVQKVGNNYKYSVYWKDLKFSGMSDGVSKFWVDGLGEIELKSAPKSEGSNPKVAEFTLPELKSQIKVDVFVKTMDQILQGAGRQQAYLKLDIETAQAEFSKKDENPVTPPTTPEKPGNTTPPNNGEKPTVPTTPATDHTKDKDIPPQPSRKTTPNSNDATIFKGLKASLMNAYQPGRLSMGNAALNRVEAYEKNGTYHYIVYFRDIKFSGLTDGITRFWVNGSEIPVVKTGGDNNEVAVHFTSTQKLTQAPVSVYVQTMENIMPGGGKQNAILVFNWTNVVEKKGSAPSIPEGPSVTPTNPTGTPGGRFNNGRLANTGLETTSSIFAGIVTLFGAIFLGRKKQN